MLGFGTGVLDFGRESEHAIGAMAQLQTLHLYRNEIGDEGMKALASALNNGALPMCTYIDLDGNPASREAKQAVKDAIKNRSK